MSIGIVRCRSLHVSRGALSIGFLRVDTLTSAENVVYGRALCQNAMSPEVPASLRGAIRFRFVATRQSNWRAIVSGPCGTELTSEFASRVPAEAFVLVLGDWVRGVPLVTQGL